MITYDIYFTDNSGVTTRDKNEPMRDQGYWARDMLNQSRHGTAGRLLIRVLEKTNLLNRIDMGNNNLTSRQIIPAPRSQSQASILPRDFKQPIMCGSRGFRAPIRGRRGMSPEIS